MIGHLNVHGDIEGAYWDRDATGRRWSAGGLPRTTAALQARLQANVNPVDWGITPGVSYPYLISGDGPLGFQGALAAVVANNKVYVFLPFRSQERSEYSVAAPNRAEASQAAVFTMIARAIGVTDEVAELTDVPIDRYFWDDEAGAAHWRGPVTQRARLGPTEAIPPETAISSSNILGAIGLRQPVNVRGRYEKPGGGAGHHWMLATSYTVDDAGVATGLVVNDPRTGMQLRIDPNTKQVIDPPNATIASFTVDAYRTVTLTPVAPPQ